MAYDNYLECILYIMLYLLINLFLFVNNFSFLCFSLHEERGGRGRGSGTRRGDPGEPGEYTRGYQTVLDITLK